MIRRIKEFVDGGVRLFWHRQSMFIAAALLAGIYYNMTIAIVCFAFCEITEAFDYVLSKKIRNWHDGGIAKARRYLNLLSISTVLSASAVSLFAILIAREEGISIHFTPLFFLFGAALFAAMNNHQLLRVLLVRLLIYGAAFLYIPIRDLWVERPSYDSYLWLQFATCLFVLYLIVDCSIIFINKYKKGLRQMEELRLERDRAEAAYKMKSQFVSIVSHELRTPLTSIKGGLGLIQSGSLGDVPKEFEKIFGIAHKNSNRLAVLIDDLLDLQKLEAGHMNFSFSNIDVFDLLQDSVESNEAYGRASDVSFKIVGKKEPYFVKGDQDRLMQVMANVLSNAVKFTNAGDVVEVAAEQHESKVRISVKDNGIGIPPESTEKVFGTFSQVDGRDRRKIGGSGLGLSIAKQIVESHGGTIGYTSKVGIGSTFVIDLDLVLTE